MEKTMAQKLVGNNQKRTLILFMNQSTLFNLFCKYFCINLTKLLMDKLVKGNDNEELSIRCVEYN